MPEADLSRRYGQVRVSEAFCRTCDGEIPSRTDAHRLMCTRIADLDAVTAAALALATPAFALNPQPLPPGMRFNPAAVNHAQGTGAWNRGAFVLRCEVRVRCQHADVCAPLTQ